MEIAHAAQPSPGLSAGDQGHAGIGTSSGDMPPSHDPLAYAADEQEIRGAMAMVSRGYALGIVLCGLRDPEAAMASLAIEAASAGVSLHLAPCVNGTDIEVRRL